MEIRDFGTMSSQLPKNWDLVPVWIIHKSTTKFFVFQFFAFKNKNENNIHPNSSLHSFSYRSNETFLKPSDHINLPLSLSLLAFRSVPFRSHSDHSSHFHASAASAAFACSVIAWCRATSIFQPPGIAHRAGLISPNRSPRSAPVTHPTYAPAPVRRSAHPMAVPPVADDRLHHFHEDVTKLVSTIRRSDDPDKAGRRSSHFAKVVRQTSRQKPRQILIPRLETKLCLVSQRSRLQVERISMEFWMKTWVNIYMGNFTNFPTYFEVLDNFSQAMA
jgi:hypothetical protein